MDVAFWDFGSKETPGNSTFLSKFFGSPSRGSVDKAGVSAQAPAGMDCSGGVCKPRSMGSATAAPPSARAPGAGTWSAWLFGK